MPNRNALHSSLRSAVVDYLRLQGAYVLPIAGGFGQRRGSPDIICGIRPVAGGDARLVALELKTGRGQQTLHQRAEQADCVQRGGIYLVIRSLDQLEEELARRGLVVPCLLSSQGAV